MVFTASDEKRSNVRVSYDEEGFDLATLRGIKLAKVKEGLEGIESILRAGGISPLEGNKRALKAIRNLIHVVDPPKPSCPACGDTTSRIVVVPGGHFADAKDREIEACSRCGYTRSKITKS